MDVILKHDIEGLGRRGDIVTVANGYFRNYIQPNGLGYRATKGAEAEAEAMRRATASKHAETRADAEELATRLVPTTITVSARTDDAGTLFGSVGVVDIVAAIEEQTGIVLDRKMLDLEHPLKTLGSHMVTAQVHPDVQFPVTVEITPVD